MSSDGDENEVDLSPEEQIEIIEWSAMAAAMVTLMWSAPEVETPDEISDKLEGFLEAITIMIAEMPEKLQDIGAMRAQYQIDRQLEQEEIVEEFIRELDEL